MYSAKHSYNLEQQKLYGKNPFNVQCRSVKLMGVGPTSTPQKKKKTSKWVETLVTRYVMT